MLTNELLQEKAKGTPPEWAAKEQAELRALVQDFGFQLLTLKPEKDQTMRGTTDMTVGGELKDKQKGDETSLPTEVRLAALRKGIAAHLLKKAKQERTLKVFTKSWWRHTPLYIHPEDDMRRAEYAVGEVVKPIYDRWDNERKNPHVYIWYSISEPKK